ncbi:HlyD family secretion protein [Lichenifustis flavocetrariae]|uniref:HlyD family secretion protein n=1 Tax=Lichenifustis flavocetrariae TaxID=2949735 RepID=A0AA42CNA4_9HYPH|nr:HlyD family secretion protein [Lichenifustis flavocetrariae]MCW6509212.1 HlyD family secretion protein [Lichenifustis flavocetrariae]
MSAATFETTSTAGSLPGQVAAKSRRPSVKRLLLGGGALALLVAGGLYGHQWWTIGRFFASTDDAYVGADVTALASQVAGFVADVPVVDNQAVRAGDVLVRIDDRPYRAALARADASVDAQEAALANLDAARRLQESVSDGARADLDAAKAETARTRFDFDRYKSLSTDQYASAQRFEQADADHKKAVAAVAKAQAALEAASRQLDVIDTQKKQTDAALGVARADREIARLNLGYTELRAPVDGVVGNRSARVGGYATVGAALVSLVPARGLWVDANFKESQLAAMHPGEVVTIEADVLPGERFTGHVASLAPATGAQFSVLPAENATGNFTKIVQRVPVRILLDGDASRLGRLRPGLSVTASVDERTAPQTRTVAATSPMEAVE